MTIIQDTHDVEQSVKQFDRYTLPLLKRIKELEVALVKEKDAQIHYYNAAMDHAKANKELEAERDQFRINYCAAKAGIEELKRENQKLRDAMLKQALKD